MDKETRVLKQCVVEDSEDSGGSVSGLTELGIIEQ